MRPRVFTLCYFGLNPGRDLYFLVMQKVLYSHGLWRQIACKPQSITSMRLNVVRCAIWQHLYNLKSVKNTHGGVLLLVRIVPNRAKHHKYGCEFKVTKTRRYL